jgi:hypothetical protein
VLFLVNAVSIARLRLQAVPNIILRRAESGEPRRGEGNIARTSSPCSPASGSSVRAIPQLAERREDRRRRASLCTVVVRTRCARSTLADCVGGAGSPGVVEGSGEAKTNGTSSDFELRQATYS